MKAQVLKLRPVLKNKQEQEEERQHIFDLPRKNTAQISPEIKRLEDLAKISNSAAQHRYHILKRILRRARYKDLDNSIMPYLYELDRSDKVIPHGEVSRKMYEKVFHAREFDLYGNLRKETMHPPRKFQELSLLASQLGIQYTQRIDPKYEHQRLNEEAEEEERRILRMRLPKLTTEPWQIGHTDREEGPVGCAPNPAQPLHSLGNEQFFSYQGQWKAGYPEGTGRYLFQDDTTYIGGWKAGRQHGSGEEVYAGGVCYRGEYKDSYFSGQGEIYMQDGRGVKYQGSFVKGVKEGKGKITYPSGMYYEGEFRAGKPHGRGTMSSALTGWRYEGTFDDGRILGSGVLYPPDKPEGVVYFWSQPEPPMSLPKLVRHYLAGLENDRAEREQREAEMHAPLRGAQLRDYVGKIRSTLYAERLHQKKAKYHEAVQKMKDQKAKLYETRLKALAGDEDDEDGAESVGGDSMEGESAGESSRMSEGDSESRRDDLDDAKADDR